jgi:hypothetical protein
MDAIEPLATEMSLQLLPINKGCDLKHARSNYAYRRVVNKQQRWGEFPRSESEVTAYMEELNSARKLIMVEAEQRIRQRQLDIAKDEFKWKDGNNQPPTTHADLINIYKMKSQYDATRQREVYALCYGIFDGDAKGWLTQHAKDYMQKMG